MRFNLLATAAAAAALGGFIGVAQAADLTPAPTGVDWSGPYIGAQVGYGESYMSGCIECRFTASKARDLTLDGITGGLHAGYNLQFDQWVVGLEADFNSNDWSDEVRSSKDSSDGQRAMVDWLGSGRVRVGYAFDDALLYATGGVAVSDAKWTDISGSNRKTAEFSDVGGVFGGGLEYMVTNHISLRAEGLYYIFDQNKNVGNFPRASSGEKISLDDMWVARVGVSFHFFAP